MKGKRLKYDFNPYRIPRGGTPPDVECPLQGGGLVSFEECLSCDQFNHDEDGTSHCLIIEEEQREGIRKQEEEFERRAAEWDAQQEKEDRKMREEMAAMNEQMEKNAKKWQKEYEKQEEEDRKRKKEWEEMDRRALVDSFGSEMANWLGEQEQKEKGLKEESEEDEEDDEDDGEWGDW